MKGKIYDYDSQMIKAAIAEGYRHIGDLGLRCDGCGNKRSMRKFMKDGLATYACNKCGYRRKQ